MRCWLFVGAFLWALQSTSTAQPTAFEHVFTIEETVTLRGDDTFPLYAPANPYVSGDRIYVPDLEENRVALFDATGTRLASVGRSGRGPGEFQMPYVMRPGQDGRIYIYERGNLRIQVFDAELNPQEVLTAPVQGDQIFPIWHDGAQRIVVTGLSACGVTRCLARIYDTNGQRIREFAALTGNPFMKTWQAAVRGEDLFLVNIYEGIVEQYDLAGQLKFTFPLSSPSALYLRQEGEVHQTRDAFRQQLRKITQQPLSVIRGLFVHEGRLFVQHENRNRSEADAKFFLDVYDLNGTLQMHGIETPGLLRSVTDRFYFVEEHHDDRAFGQITIRAARLGL